MTLGELRIAISEMYYILDDNLLNWMVFHFYIPGEKNGKQKAGRVPCPEKVKDKGW